MYIICLTLQHTATHCNTLRHTATHGNTLQHTATHCTRLIRSGHYDCGLAFGTALGLKFWALHCNTESKGAGRQQEVIATSPLEGCFAAALSAAIAFFLQQQPCCRAPGEPAVWHQHAGSTASSHANISTRRLFCSSIISSNSPFSAASAVLLCAHWPPLESLFGRILVAETWRRRR